MNQRGDVTLMGVFLLVVLSGVLLLTALELRRSYGFLEKRSRLFLCAKETKGELVRYLEMMGRSNWALKHLQTAALVAAFIPGLQGVALNVEKARDLLKNFQTALLFFYFKKVRELKGRDCPLDPRLYLTPFRLGARGFERDEHGAAKLRKEQWELFFMTSPYLLRMKLDLKDIEAIMPKVRVRVEEKGATLSSLSSSSW